MVGISEVLLHTDLISPLPFTQDLSTVYTVPSGKIAKISIEFIKIVVSISSNTDSGGTFYIDQELHFGDIKIHLRHGTDSTSEILQGGSQDESDLIDAADFWRINGEFIEPKEEDVYMKGESTFVLLPRDFQGSGDASIAPRKIPRSWYLPALSTFKYGIKITSNLTFSTPSSPVISVAIGGEVVLEDS